MQKKCCIDYKRKAVIIETFYHIFCTPNLTLSDYYLFLLLKNSLHDKRFQSVSEIKMHLEEYFINKPYNIHFGKRNKEISI